MHSGDFYKYEGFPQLIGEVCRALFDADDWDIHNLTSVIMEKRQTETIVKHLADLKLQCWVIERKYVDKDFMEDYSHYYSRCFKQYPRKCCRVHFFGLGVDVEKVKEILWGIEDGNWKTSLDAVDEAYLGFIVFRPLPPTVYSRICLRPVSIGDAALATTDIDVHLFGASLKVKTTIPFQEQDSVVAACATSALWSAFQITGRKLLHCIPSPHRITHLATEGGACESRPFPTKGLTVGEIGRAIFRMGLSQQSLSTYDQAVFRAEAYAYLRLGLPIILCGTIRNPGETKDSENWHAVTALGFEIPKAAKGVTCRNVSVRGAAIKKLYCHDDRLGPFFVFNGEPENRDEDNPLGSLIKWKTYEKKKVFMSDCTVKDDYERFTVRRVVAPVYHKLRLGFTDVLDALEVLHAKILTYLEEKGYACELDIHHLTWDLYLSTSIALKKQSKNPQMGLERSLVEKICCEPMPKYVWIASAIEKERRLGTFLVDATGIAQDINVFAFVGGEDSFRMLLYAAAKSTLEDVGNFETVPGEMDIEARQERDYCLTAARNPFMRCLFKMIQKEV